MKKFIQKYISRGRVPFCIILSTLLSTLIGCVDNDDMANDQGTFYSSTKGEPSLEDILDVIEKAAAKGVNIIHIWILQFFKQFVNPFNSHFMFLSDRFSLFRVLLMILSL